MKGPSGLPGTPRGKVNQVEISFCLAEENSKVSSLPESHEDRPSSVLLKIGESVAIFASVCFVAWLGWKVGAKLLENKQNSD